MTRMNDQAMPKAIRQPDPLVFSDHFRFGIPEIDADHAELIATLNRAIDASLGTAEMRALLEDFAARYAEHCRMEEEFLHSIRYAYVHAHEQSHRELDEQITDACRALPADARAARAMVETVCQAFMNHMLYDLQFKSFVDALRDR